jgi:DNA polymerase elongation subunit (family B)
MLLDFEYSKGKIVLSEIDEHGDIKMSYYPWRNPKKYISCSESDPEKHPKYRTWDKRPVKLIGTNMPNRFSIYEFLDRLPEEDKKRIFEYKEPKIFFVDIETEILDTGFVEPINANSKVLTIAIVYNNKAMVLGLKPLPQKEIDKVKDSIESHFDKFELKIDFRYISFHDRENPEKDMLEYFFEKLVPKMPVISGWNFLDYDWTFLINRCRRIGIKPEVCSYTQKLDKIFGTDYEVPAHRLVLDYMEIYKKWDTSVKVKESNALNWVGEKVLDLNHGAKVAYSGSLMDLYEQDFTKYVFYNAVDTVLVQLIHEKMQYIKIAYSIANLAKIRLCDFAYKNLNTTLVQTEGFLREKFRNEKSIVFSKEDEEIDAESIAGGWVKPPAKGINEWIACFDFASLYPTTMRQFNIAPEMFMGYQMKDKPEYAEFNGRITRIEEDKHIVCINGTVFERGYSVTVNFLETVYNERQRFKSLMKVENKKHDNTKKEVQSLKEELEALRSM